MSNAMEDLRRVEQMFERCPPGPIRHRLAMRHAELAAKITGCDPEAVLSSPMTAEQLEMLQQLETIIDGPRDELYFTVRCALSIAARDLLEEQGANEKGVTTFP